MSTFTKHNVFMWFRNQIRRTGVPRAIQALYNEGRLLPISTAVPNWLFQRVLGINRNCRYSVHYTSQIIYPRRLRIGRGVRRYLASSQCLYIQCANGVSIGDNTMIGPGVKLISANHQISNDHAQTSHDSGTELIIGANVWIGAGVIVLPGSNIGDGAVIGAGAVVTRPVSSRTIVVGNPAVFLRTIEPE